MKNAEEFVTALATLTENLLLQLDNILTPNEVQGVWKSTHLVYHRQAGTHSEEKYFVGSRYKGFLMVNLNQATWGTTLLL